MSSRRLIETDNFDFAFLSRLGERESWRKEVHRPVYHVHKWWAKRLGTIFRGILLGSMLDEDASLSETFYQRHAFSDLAVFDPFMGSGTTVGEAHKLGFTALGRDINPVAVESVRVALGPLDRRKIKRAFAELSDGVGETIRTIYQSEDSRERTCDVLYYFWVMQAACPHCEHLEDLFSSYIFARNARPDRNPEVQIVCPSCGHIFAGLLGQRKVACPSCRLTFDPEQAPVAGKTVACTKCGKRFATLDAVDGKRPPFRLYGKLVLRKDGKKEYLPPSRADIEAYADCSRRLHEGVQQGNLVIPTLALQKGYNTKQAMRYGFLSWCDFFNDRQLLVLSLLRSAIEKLTDSPTRQALLTLFSGVLEFNNLFASYKGEGTGAVRHMFAHHILKPERTPIEANVWGTSKSSGSFSNLFRSRLLRAIDYRESPTEVNGTGSASGRVCSPPFTGKLCPWEKPTTPHGIALSCGDSATTGLPDRCIDLIVTDPPFFDNVHYSELADFFFAWQQLPNEDASQSTRNKNEVQDSSADQFSKKLQSVLRECHRVLKDDGLLVFTYHHSRNDGWKSLAEAVLGAGLTVVNAHPVKSEMSVATPKSQAKEPIQLDIVVICRKALASDQCVEAQDAIDSARAKLRRLQMAGFRLSRNDQKVVFYGQLLTTLASASEADAFADYVERELVDIQSPALAGQRSLPLFPDD
jgi:putative DNA methylase